MSFARYAILVLALVVLGLVTVWGHLRLLSVGYELNEFRGSRDRLEEESRVLGRRIDALATPSAAAAKVRALGIGLAPPARRGTTPRPGAGRSAPRGPSGGSGPAGTAGSWRGSE